MNHCEHVCQRMAQAACARDDLQKIDPDLQPDQFREQHKILDYLLETHCSDTCEYTLHADGSITHPSDTVCK